MLNLFGPTLVGVKISYSTNSIYIDAKGSSGGIHSITIPRHLAKNRTFTYAKYSMPWRYWPYQETVRESSDSLVVAWEGAKLPELAELLRIVEPLATELDFSSLERETLVHLLNQLVNSSIRLEELSKLDKVCMFLQEN